MSKSFRKVSEHRTFHVVTTIIIIIIVLVGISAMLYRTGEENPFEEGDIYYSYGKKTPIADALDYYLCPNCNTIVPCPHNHNGNGISCPSCGLKMNVMQIRTAATHGVQGANLNAADGFYLGLGAGGNLVCPDCGLVVAHQAGVPAYSVQCPKCRTSMVRQLSANVPTAFYQNTRNNNNSNFKRSLNATAPPITSNAIISHEYRGVCSKCHQIIDRPTVRK